MNVYVRLIGCCNHHLLPYGYFSKGALVAGQCGYFSVMCLGDMTTHNDENCVRRLFSAIGKVLIS